MTPKNISKEKQAAFLKGREYERISLKREFSRKSIAEAGRKLLKKFPEYKKPDDGNGDEDASNRGFNSALDELAKIIIDFYQ